MSKHDIEFNKLEEFKKNSTSLEKDVETKIVYINGKQVIVPLHRQRALNAPYSSRVEKPHHGLHLAISENLALYDFHNDHFVKIEHKYGRELRKEVMSFLQFKIFYIIRYSPGRHKPKSVEYPEEFWYGKVFDQELQQYTPLTDHRLCIHPRELLSDYKKYYLSPPTPTDLLNKNTRERYTLKVRDYVFIKKTQTVVRGCNMIKSILKEISILDIRNQGEEDYESRRAALFLELEGYNRQRDNLSKGLTAEGAIPTLSIAKPLDLAAATAKIGVQRKVQYSRHIDELNTNDLLKELRTYSAEWRNVKPDSVDPDDLREILLSYRDGEILTHPPAPLRSTLKITSLDVERVEGSINYVTRSANHDNEHLEPGPWLPEFIFDEGNDVIYYDSTPAYQGEYPRFDFCNEAVWSRRIMTPFFDRGAYPSSHLKPVFGIIVNSYWEFDENDDDDWYEDLQLHRRMLYITLVDIATLDPLCHAELNGNNGSATNTDDVDSGKIYKTEAGLTPCSNGNSCSQVTHWHRLKKTDKALSGGAKRVAEKAKLCKEVIQCFFSMGDCVARGDEMEHYHVTDHMRKDGIRNNFIQEEEMELLPNSDSMRKQFNHVIVGNTTQFVPPPEYQAPSRVKSHKQHAGFLRLSPSEITKISHDINLRNEKLRKERLKFSVSPSLTTTTIAMREETITNVPHSVVRGVDSTTPSPVAELLCEPVLPSIDPQELAIAAALTEIKIDGSVVLVSTGTVDYNVEENVRGSNLTNVPHVEDDFSSTLIDDTPPPLSEQTSPEDIVFTDDILSTDTTLRSLFFVNPYRFSKDDRVSAVFSFLKNGEGKHCVKLWGGYTYAAPAVMERWDSIIKLQALVRGFIAAFHVVKMMEDKGQIPHASTHAMMHIPLQAVHGYANPPVANYAQIGLPLHVQAHHHNYGNVMQALLGQVPVFGAGVPGPAPFNAAGVNPVFGAGVPGPAPFNAAGANPGAAPPNAPGANPPVVPGVPPPPPGVPPGIPPLPPGGLPVPPFIGPLPLVPPAPVLPLPIMPGPAIPPNIVFQLNQVVPPPLPPAPPVLPVVVLPAVATIRQVDIMLQKEVVDWASYYWSDSYRSGAVSESLMSGLTRLFSFCQYTTNTLPVNTVQSTVRDVFTSTEMETYIPLISEFFGRWRERMEFVTDLSSGAYNHTMHAIIFVELHEYLLQQCGEVAVAGLNSSDFNTWLFSRVMNIVPLYSREYFDPAHYQRTIQTIVYVINILVMNHQYKVMSVPKKFKAGFNSSRTYIRRRGHLIRGGEIYNYRNGGGLLSNG